MNVYIYFSFYSIFNDSHVTLTQQKTAKKHCKQSKTLIFKAVSQLASIVAVTQ